MSTPSTDKPRLSRAHLLDLLRQMLRIRRFEERCVELYTQEKIRGFLHVYIGEEAVGTGVMHGLAPDDAVVSTYREHGHALLNRIPMERVMAEMYGKQAGCSMGRGGSMHLFDASARFVGGNAIVGGGLPLAVGLALADRLAGRNRVTVCFFGDGAAAEGSFHESLNLAALWQLPVLFVCENNLYAMGTALRYAHAQTELHRKAEALGVPAECVDGMDIARVEAASARLLAALRSGEGPRFLECRTYRFRAHSMFDPELYRDKAEVEEWKARDPIQRLSQWMQQSGLLPEQELAALEAEIDAEVVDLRVLRPLDTATLLDSVGRTHRAVIVDEGWKTGSLAGELAAILAEQAFWALDAPIERVCSDEIPIPYPQHLENAALPQVADILAAARRAMGAAP